MAYSRTHIRNLRFVICLLQHCLNHLHLPLIIQLLPIPFQRAEHIDIFKLLRLGVPFVFPRQALIDHPGRFFQRAARRRVGDEAARVNTVEPQQFKGDIIQVRLTARGHALTAMVEQGVRAGGAASVGPAVHIKQTEPHEFLVDERGKTIAGAPPFLIVVGGVVLAQLFGEVVVLLARKVLHGLNQHMQRVFVDEAQRQVAVAQDEVSVRAVGVGHGRSPIEEGDRCTYYRGKYCWLVQLYVRWR